jgi:hypothetical protein
VSADTAHKWPIPELAAESPPASSGTAEPGLQQVRGTDDHGPAIRGGLLGRSATARRDQTAGPDTGVLACRIAGTLAEHHPGWRMPRLSVLVRHYGVSSEGVAAAVEELQRRQLIRRLPNGQFCRSSPAEYRIPLGAGPALSVGVYPVAGTLGCRSATVSHRPLREDAARAIGSAAGEPGCTLSASLHCRQCASGRIDYLCDRRAQRARAARGRGRLSSRSTARRSPARR